MPIVSEKKFLTKEELDQLHNIQKQTQDVIFELGEIEIIKLQLEQRHNNAKRVFSELTEIENNFSQKIYDTYGKVQIDPKNGEITTIS
jgi:hypothetical protein